MPGPRVAAFLLFVATLSAGCAHSASDVGTNAARDGTLQTMVTAASPDEPPTTWDTTSPGWEQRKGAAAVALIEYPWRALGWTIVFKPGRTGIISATYPARRLIEVYVRDDMPVVEVAHSIAHEVGHAHDLTYFDNGCRQAWREARGVRGDQRWLAPDGSTDYGIPGGDFAEVFAIWALGGKGPFKGKLAPRPDDDELDELSRFFVPQRPCRGQPH